MRKNIKLTAIPSLHNNPNSVQKPKQEFMAWCWKNGRELVEMVQDCDFEIFDKLWPDIANIFGLTYEGNCATCERDCDTCRYKDGPFNDGSPCWECGDGKSQYIR